MSPIHNTTSIESNEDDVGVQVKYVIPAIMYVHVPQPLGGITGITPHVQTRHFHCVPFMERDAEILIMSLQGTRVWVCICLSLSQLA